MARSISKATRQLVEVADELLPRGRADDSGRVANNRALRQRNCLLQINITGRKVTFYPYNIWRVKASYWFKLSRTAVELGSRERRRVIFDRVSGAAEFAPNNILYHEGAKWEMSVFSSAGGFRASQSATPLPNLWRVLRNNA